MSKDGKISFFCQQMDLPCRMHLRLLFHIQHLYVKAEMPVAFVCKPCFRTLTTGQLSHSTPYPELKCGDETVWVVRVPACPQWLLGVGL